MLEAVANLEDMMQVNRYNRDVPHTMGTYKDPTALFPKCKVKDKYSDFDHHEHWSIYYIVDTYEINEVLDNIVGMVDNAQVCSDILDTTKCMDDKEVVSYKCLFRSYHLRTAD